MTENNIKSLRLEKHLSQEQLAEKARVSVRTIQRLEAGDEASIETLNLIAGALDVEVSDLFKQSSKKAEEAADQLNYQLSRRHEEFHMYKLGFNLIFIVLMMAWGVCFRFMPNYLIPVSGWIWCGCWILFGFLRKFYLLNIVDPKLDRKYPLTASRIDKDD